jgi:hypothetical protein
LTGQNLDKVQKEKGMPNKGTPNKGTPNKAMPSKAMPNRTMLEQETSFTTAGYALTDISFYKIEKEK